ncbi:MAG: tetratricopeptide repeat protein, partial [Kofleriaceae bacterium]
RRWAHWQWVVAVPTLAFFPKLIGRLWTWIAVALALGLWLGQLPLAGVLGLELALIAAVFSAVMGLDVGSAIARAVQRSPASVAQSEPPGATMTATALAAAVVTFAIALVPALICAIRGLWVPTCDWWFGVTSYLAMPLVTAAFAGALGAGLGTIAGPRRFVGAILAQLPIGIVIATALWRFYAEPPVFSYNAILGFTPGNLYDENVQLTRALWWSRLETLAWVVAVLALLATRLDVPTFRITRAPRPRGHRRGAAMTATVAALVAVVLRSNSGALGYAIDREDIEDALGGRIETAHFIIHYANTAVIEPEIALIAADHEFRYSQVVAQLGVEPSRKLRSFYFASRQQKATWFGARDAEMAKPWLHEIYLDHQEFPHRSLRHEIAHAVASEFGDPWFGVAIKDGVFANPGLIEGLAVAIDWPGDYDRITPHQAVRALQLMGKQPSVTTLFTLQFFSVSATTGYTTAGSFIRFLLDRYGAVPLRAVYGNGGDFAGAYGKSLSELEAEWRQMISAISLPDAVVEATRERFRQRSVFGRPCPHAIAKRRERAHRDDDPRGAISLMRQVCRDAPEEPRYRLELGDFLASGNDVERGEALRLWTEIAHDDQGITSTLRGDAFQRLARAAWARGATDETRALIGEAVQLPIDPNQRRTLDGIAVALAHQGPAGDALRDYFFGTKDAAEPVDLAKAITVAEPALGVGHYLLGLQYVLHDNWAAAVPELERALQLELPGQAFERNAARWLAIAGYRMRDRPRVERAIATLSRPVMSESDHMLARDWTERLAFDAR